MITLEKGEIVMVYRDPLTRQIEEGYAKLIKRIQRDPDTEQEYWEVIFTADSSDLKVCRWINAPIKGKLI